MVVRWCLAFGGGGLLGVSMASLSKHVCVHSHHLLATNTGTKACRCTAAASSAMCPVLAHHKLDHKASLIELCRVYFLSRHRHVPGYAYFNPRVTGNEPERTLTPSTCLSVQRPAAAFREQIKDVNKNL